MKKLLLILIFIFNLNVLADTVSMDEYSCLPDDTADDSPCVVEAVGDLIDGGTVRFPKGVWHVDTMIDLTQSNNYISLEFLGDTGAVIQLGATDSTTLFYAGNLNQLSFKGLIFLGIPDVTYDAEYLIYTVYTQQTLIEGNQFFGIRVKEHLIYAGNSDVVIRGNQFEGNASKSLIYGANNLRSMTVENNTFLDYANYKNQFLTKTFSGNEAWIEINRTLDTGNNASSPYVTIRNNRFDEGAYYAVKAYNLNFLDVTNAMVNVGGAGGIYLSNVNRARITSSAFGYNPNAVPAVTALNATTAILDGATLGGGVVYYVKDGTSSVVVK
jgi:hypothetical protein